MSTTTAPSCSPPALSTEHAATLQVAEKLVGLLAVGKNLQAISELYADNARHVEVMDAPWCPRITQGKAELLKKAEQFARDTEIHSATCGKPIVNGDQFVCTMGLDCTSKQGPMAGQRMNISETALYTVRNGRITEAKFFYCCGM
ncbi:MAG: nuclear transport factor 2 family protein [Phycisphaerae bacterium]|nr:nuclear transport factor 2 family protein [Phycisphaerae bacterium]